MANRHGSYDEIMVKKFEDKEYAQGYLLHIVNDEGLSIEESLRETIKAMGLQNFADKADISVQSVSDFVAKRRKWSVEKQSEYIKKVFELKIKITLENPKASKVA